METIESIPPCTDAAREKLHGSLKNKRVSLTAAEAAFLSKLLLDPVSGTGTGTSTNTFLDESDHATQMHRASERLNDDMLFRTPFADEPMAQPPKCRRGQANFIGMWKAFEEGVQPKFLVHEAGQREARRRAAEEDHINATLASADSDSIKSDEEVRTDETHCEEDLEYESWDEQETAPEHYDAWAVLKDEYARDFGFDYNNKLVTAEGIDTDDLGHSFRILGTSADDMAAQPHVLSPPLMDALMNFLPPSLVDENYWLKFSLIRDGASLDTLKRYVRGAKHTILAIETTTGEVFGSFTSSPWKTHNGYYGEGEAFLWRMRQSRRTKVHSLFEQAHMETEIDTFPFSGKNDLIQLCTEDRIAIGGGEMEPGTGFGLTIDDDLLNGTSSPCATFLNPCLVNGLSKGESFKIVNFECWGLTPCLDVDDAERLEMTKFFVQESSRSLGSGVSSPLSSRDIMQPEFYRRVGTNDQSAEGRDRWQYAAMMGTQGFR